MYTNFDQMLWGPYRGLMDAAGQGNQNAINQIAQLRAQFQSYRTPQQQYADRLQAAIQQRQMAKQQFEAAMPSWMRIDDQTGANEGNAARQRYLSEQVNPMVGKLQAREGAAGNSFVQAQIRDVQNIGGRAAQEAYDQARQAPIQSLLNARQQAYGDAATFSDSEEGQIGSMRPYTGNAQRQLSDYGQQMSGGEKIARIGTGAAGLLGAANRATNGQLGQAGSSFLSGVIGAPANFARGFGQGFLNGLRGGY